MLLRSLPLLLAVASALAAELRPAPAAEGNGTTVYDLLPKFGLPSGLLPDTVSSFSLAENGAFTVELSGACYVQFEYLVYYAPKITGVIKYGGIEDLKGIQVRRFLVWFNVEAIKVDLPPSDCIYFQVGWITKSLRMDQFRTVHSCEKDRRLLVDRVREASKILIRLPEPVREIEMLLTE